MSLHTELGLEPIEYLPHEAVLNIVFTGSLLSKEGDRILKEFGLTDSQFNVLMLLKYQAKDGVLNQTTLGDMLLVNRSNITGLIDRLEQAGCVKRTGDSNDRRVKWVQMTKQGRAVLDKSEEAYYKRIGEIMDDLSDAECKRLCRALESIRGKIRTSVEI